MKLVLIMQRNIKNPHSFLHLDEGSQKLSLLPDDTAI